MPLRVLLGAISADVMSLETQGRIRNNVEQTMAYVDDLNGWLQDVKRSESSNKGTSGRQDPMRLAQAAKLEGNRQAQSQEWAAAAESYSEALALLTTSSGVERFQRVLLSNRALCHLKLGRINDCISDCDKSLILQMTPKALFRRASAYAQTKRFAEARIDLAACANMTALDVDMAQLVKEKLDSIGNEERLDIEKQPDTARDRICRVRPGWVVESSTEERLIKLNVDGGEQSLQMTPAADAYEHPRTRYVPKCERLRRT